MFKDNKKREMGCVMSGCSKEFVENVFDEYRFKIKGLQLIKSELNRLYNQVNKSAIKNDFAIGTKKDMCDRYNDKIEKKKRLENTSLTYENYISTVNDVLELLNSEYPMECMVLKLKHIECRTITQIEEKTFFSRGKCFKMLKKAEEEFERLMDLVS